MRECEEMLKIVQSSRDLQLDLVDSSRAVDVILFSLDCLSILLYAYVHILHINCLIITLN